MLDQHKGSHFPSHLAWFEFIHSFAMNCLALCYSALHVALPWIVSYIGLPWIALRVPFEVVSFWPTPLWLPPLPTGFFIADTICFSGLSDRFLANICVTHAYFILVYLFVLMFSLYLYLFHRTAWLISSIHLCSSLFPSHDNHIRDVQILL